MLELIIKGLQTVNELLIAGIAITAFSLLLYALTFNLRDRVARSFAFILLCMVIVSGGEAIASVTNTFDGIRFWLHFEWLGIIFLPPAYMHFSDALLETTGRPSRGRRRRLVRVVFVISIAFLAVLVRGWLVGPLLIDLGPVPYLERTWLTWVFALYYVGVIGWGWVNIWRAYQRTVTSTTRRRMRYLLLGALAPALGSYPFLLLGPGTATAHPLLFWVAAVLSNLLVSIFLVLMAYAVAFFGVAWPDRVVKRRLFKWLMRGPVTASTVLAVTTIVRRVGDAYDLSYQTAMPVIMVATLLILEHMITLIAPLWERWLFHGGDRENLQLIQTLEERLLTTGDLRDFLESVLAAVCDRLQVTKAFLVTLGSEGSEMLVMLGNQDPFGESELPQDLAQEVSRNGGPDVQRTEYEQLFHWKDYWIIPLFVDDDEGERLIGLLGAGRNQAGVLDQDQVGALHLLTRRAVMALQDRQMQQQVFTSVEALTPQVDLIQRLRAAARYDGVEVLTSPLVSLDDRDLSRWVKDALSHYWGGPKLSQSPLLRLQIVQRALESHDGNPTNALRAILQDAIERMRPEGERRFTGEWILYNILEMKFMEGRKVREIAIKLSVSEADLYRKQRVAIETVAKAIAAMEKEAREEQFSTEQTQEVLNLSN
jgi:hypothetical protein